MILVKLHCERCNRVMHAIEQRPADWGETLLIRACKCVRVDLATDEGQEIARHDFALQRTAGRMLRVIQWSDLQPFVERAERVGKTQRVVLDVT